MLNCCTELQEKTKKDSYMSAKRLDQVAQATKTAFVFPGQGSQKVGMLAEIAEQFSGVQNTFAEASEALVLICGRLPKLVKV
jgi:[acyl-carrier-protein] S-malonyltransferase